MADVVGEGGNRGGPALAGYGMAGDAGSIVGPVLAAWTVELGGYPAAFGLTALIAIGSLLCWVHVLKYVIRSVMSRRSPPDTGSSRPLPVAPPTVPPSHVSDFLSVPPPFFLPPPPPPLPPPPPPFLPPFPPPPPSLSPPSPSSSLPPPPPLPPPLSPLLPPSPPSFLLPLPAPLSLPPPPPPPPPLPHHPPPPPPPPLLPPLPSPPLLHLPSSLPPPPSLSFFLSNSSLSRPKLPGAAAAASSCLSLLCRVLGGGGVSGRGGLACPARHRGPSPLSLPRLIALPPNSLCSSFPSLPSSSPPPPLPPHPPSPPPPPPLSPPPRPPPPPPPPTPKRGENPSLSSLPSPDPPPTPPPPDRQNAEPPQCCPPCRLPPVPAATPPLPSTATHITPIPPSTICTRGIRWDRHLLHRHPIPPPPEPPNDPPRPESDRIRPSVTELTHILEAATYLHPPLLPPLPCRHRDEGPAGTRQDRMDITGARWPGHPQPPTSPNRTRPYWRYPTQNTTHHSQHDPATPPPAPESPKGLAPRRAGEVARVVAVARLGWSPTAGVGRRGRDGVGRVGLVLPCGDPRAARLLQTQRKPVTSPYPASARCPWGQPPPPPPHPPDSWRGPVICRACPAPVAISRSAPRDLHPPPPDLRDLSVSVVCVHPRTPARTVPNDRYRRPSVTRAPHPDLQSPPPTPDTSATRESDPSREPCHRWRRPPDRGNHRPTPTLRTSPFPSRT